MAGNFVREAKSGLAPIKEKIGKGLGWAIFQLTVQQLLRTKGRLGVGPLTLVGYFSGTSGVARSAQLASEALTQLGIPHRCIDVLDPKPLLDGERSACAWIFYVNPPELMPILHLWNVASLTGLRFGHWAWELPRAPKSWLRAAGAMDGVMAQSRHSAVAFQPCPVTVTPHPLWRAAIGTARFKEYRNSEGQKFRVVALFDFKSSYARKNPDGAILAFKKAFGENPNTEFILKTQNGESAPELFLSLKQNKQVNISVEDGNWKRSRVVDLIASADVFISLHRAEGFGLGLAEAMMIGTPTIATDWSGNLDFMTHETAYLVPARLIKINDPQKIYQAQMWAEPDISVAAQMLRKIYTNPQAAHKVALLAQSHIVERLSPVSWYDTFPPLLKYCLNKAALPMV